MRIVAPIPGKSTVGVELPNTEKELVIVQEFLPKELSLEEIKAAVEQAIKDVGATSIKEMGKVMKEALGKHPGIDGKVVNQFVRELLK